VARFPTGTTFLGRYVLLGPVGHGGVSVVYQAVDTFDGRHVAIKMLDPTRAGDNRAQERMRREAVITERMRHPSVPRIYEYGDAPLGDGTSVAYAVMALLSGTVLADELTHGPLPWEEAVRIAATVADVLAVAHKRGIVHRDIRPANIMMTKDGAKIIDFGVAVTVDTPDPGEGPFVLPPPERPANDFAGPGEPADDVYAVGMLLYQLVSGRSPHAVDAPPSAHAGRTHALPPPVLEVAGVPRTVADICRRCMARRPPERPDSAQLALDLWALILPSAVPLAISGPPAPSVTTMSLPIVPTPVPPPAPPGTSALRHPTTRARVSTTMDISRRKTLELPGRPRRGRRRPAWASATSGQYTVVPSG
jgi:serine/threonine protein kinase